MCTSLTIGTPDSGIVYGRTMEFTLDLRSEILVVPAGIALRGTDRHGVLGEGGLAWDVTHAAVGANALGLPILLDGVNDAGLVVGSLNFPVSAGYPEVSDADQAGAIASFEVGLFLLTTCATVDEVRAALARVPVQGVALAAYGGHVPPLHYTVHDAAGGSIVVEHTGGALQIHENPTTVMTNEPPFPMQLANLAQYQYISNRSPAPIELDGLTLAAPSSGDGTNGLPAGFLATSRFVRAFWSARFAPTFDTPAEGVQLARHLMNGFDIPPGSVMTDASGGESGGRAGFEITQWTSIVDLQHRVFYASSYDHPSLVKVDVARAAGGLDAITTIPLPGVEAIQELGV